MPTIRWATAEVAKVEREAPAQAQFSDEPF